MADTKLTALSAISSVSLDDLLYVVDDPAGTPVSKQATAQQLFDAFGVKQMRFVRKTSDETVTSSTTLQSDDELLFAVGAGETWLFNIYVLYDGPTAADIKLNLSVPASATYHVGGHSNIPGTAGNDSDLRNLTTVSSGFDLAFGTPGSSNPILLSLAGCVVVSSTAGDVVLQWAQNTSNGTATRVWANSWLIAYRVV